MTCSSVRFGDHKAPSYSFDGSLALKGSKQSWPVYTDNHLGRYSA